MPSGIREPLISLSNISFSGGPSQTRRMSWDASVSKARNWRLKKHNDFIVSFNITQKYNFNNKTKHAAEKKTNKI